MSDCPDCDNNEGWNWEWMEAPDDELRGRSYRVKCRNWRHRMRPSLEEIATALREGREPPPSHILEEQRT